jgi:hypothetical protein
VDNAIETDQPLDIIWRLSNMLGQGDSKPVVVKWQFARAMIGQLVLGFIVHEGKLELIILVYVRKVPL